MYINVTMGDKLKVNNGRNVTMGENMLKRNNGQLLCNCHCCDVYIVHANTVLTIF